MNSMSVRKHGCWETYCSSPTFPLQYLCKVFYSYYIKHGLTECASMMNSSDEFDLHNCGHALYYWNNWNFEKDLTNYKRCGETPTDSKSYVATFKKLESRPMLALNKKESKYGNWIPPTNFGDNEKNGRTTDISDNVGDIARVDEFSTSNVILLEMEELRNRRWEVRTMCDVNNLKDGDLVWCIVDPGSFGLIKLWVRECGDIQSYAEGKLRTQVNEDNAFMIINTTENLRKMLGIRNTQWVSFLESIQHTEVVLKYCLWEGYNPKGMSCAEKLWYFICRRRHFLPAVSIYLKLTGWVTKGFDFLPKLIVQDVRDVGGGEI